MLIGVDLSPSRIFVRLPLVVQETVPPSPFSDLTVRIVIAGGEMWLEISTTADELYRDFHRFAEIIVEEFERPEASAVSAYLKALRRWGALTAKKSILSAQEEIGLWGELVLLDAVLRKHGSRYIYAWTGRETPAGRHDFRFGGAGVEVKCTQAASRTHTVHGLDQLMPSPGMALFILSLKAEAAGMQRPGTTLAAKVAAIRQLLIGAPEHEEFDYRLLRAGFDDESANNYERRFVLVDIPMLVPVDESCPKLTVDNARACGGESTFGRISDVAYQINVDGLGFPFSGVSTIPELVGIDL